MPHPIKKVRVICHEPIAVHKNYEQGWSDVWLRFKLRRKTVLKGPTLISRESLRSDIEFEKRFLESHPQYADQTIKEIDAMKAIDSALNSVGMIAEHSDEGCPTVYTAENSITHATARQMIAHLLQHYGIGRHVQKWKVPRGGFVIPV